MTNLFQASTGRSCPDCPGLFQSTRQTRRWIAHAAALALLLFGVPAHAQLTGDICVSDALGNPGGNFCTANDVRITAFTVQSGPDSCEPGETYTATLIAEIESGPDRYGIGLWFNEDGLGAKTPGAECTRDILQPAGPNASCDSSNPAGLGPFWDANGDACGDVTSNSADCPLVETRPCSEGGGTCAVHRRVVEVTTVCVDTDGDNVADISSCTSWDQSSGDMCNSISDTAPGTTSKCHCGNVTTTDIFVGCRSDAECDNGAFCDGAEVCNMETNMCEPGTPPVVDDGVSCTSDVCDEELDQVTNTPDDSVCDNGLWCDGAEVCDPVNDCQAGTPPVCGDGVSCTNDLCDEASDQCVNTPDDSLCDNGAWCDGTETCDPAAGCLPGTPPVVDDGVSCTNDVCDEDNDVVVNTPDDSICDNGAWCDGAETCDPVNDCQPGTPPVVDDGVSCTNDVCDEDNDVVVNTPDDSICDNGAWCDGAETCDPVNDCQPGTPPECGDGVSCTNDVCDEDNDQCVNTPDDSQCDDGQFCNGAEICDPVNDCVNGSAPPVADAFACTADACDEETDQIVHEPIDAQCDDGNFCNGAEMCDPEQGCVDADPGTWPGAGEACGSDLDTACTDPDTCDGEGNCLANNEECGSVTSSALCEFDVEPTKGTCTISGEACMMGSDDCGLDDECVQSKQFRVGFGPDAQNWVSYRLGATNPGQFYYNAIYDASAAIDGIELSMEIPFPFITQGANPLHVYDSYFVGSNEEGCYLPPDDALWANKYIITTDDWLQPPGYVAPDYLACDQVDTVGGSGFCLITVPISQAIIDGTEEGILYANLHLDYGFKGPHTDINPWDDLLDRYDRGPNVSPWNSADALENTPTDDGPVAVADCSTYSFAHYIDDDPVPVSGDAVQNLNEFKKFNGVFGRVYCGDDDAPITGFMTLQKAGGGEVANATEVDSDGYYSLGYRHRGKPSLYELKWCSDALCSNVADIHVTDSFPLKGSAEVGVDLVAVDACDMLNGDADSSDWTDIDPVYTSGKYAKK